MTLAMGGVPHAGSRQGRRLTDSSTSAKSGAQGTHSCPPKGPNQQRPGVLTKGLATKGAGSGRGGHTMDCRHGTPGARSGGGHPGDCRHVTPCIGSGVESPLRVFTGDLRCGVWGSHSSARVRIMCTWRPPLSPFPVACLVPLRFPPSELRVLP